MPASRRQERTAYELMKRCLDEDAAVFLTLSLVELNLHPSTALWPMLTTLAIEVIEPKHGTTFHLTHAPEMLRCRDHRGNADGDYSKCCD